MNVDLLLFLEPAIHGAKLELYKAIERAVFEDQDAVCGAVAHLEGAEVGDAGLVVGFGGDGGGAVDEFALVEGVGCEAGRREVVLGVVGVFPDVLGGGRVCDVGFVEEDSDAPAGW